MACFQAVHEVLGKTYMQTTVVGCGKYRDKSTSQTSLGKQ